MDDTIKTLAVTTSQQAMVILQATESSENEFFMPTTSWAHKLGQLRVNFVRWAVLRSIGNSSTVKLTIFIPIIGYLIIFNETLVHYLALSHDLFGKSDSSTGSVPWRLLFLYFGLCFIAAASMIYTFRCPNVIKRSGSSAEFIAVESDHTPGFALRLIEKQLEVTRFADALKKIKSQGKSHLKARKANESEQSIIKKYDKEILALYYAWSNTRRPWSRVATSAIYLIGFTFIAIPSANVFWKVALTVGKSLTAWFGLP